MFITPNEYFCHNVRLVLRGTVAVDQDENGDAMFIHSNGDVVSLIQTEEGFVLEKMRFVNADSLPSADSSHQHWLCE